MPVMSIEDDIVQWALYRPAWQQEVLVGLTDGEQFDESRISALTDRLLEADSQLPSKDAKRISVKSSAAQQVQLTALEHTRGVNSLVDNQTLTFSTTGLTVIYGDNGSGKSGYARLIKGMVNARHASTVLPNVFDDAPSDPAAVLNFMVNGAAEVLRYPGTPTPDTLKMSFYDEHCGDEYLTKQSTITYRPSALVLLDGLIAVCDLIREEIQGRIRDNHAEAIRVSLPAETTAGAFLAGLSARTTDDQITKATQLAGDTNEALAKALAEEARLKGSDPSKERTRLQERAGQLNGLQAALAGHLAYFSQESAARLVALRFRARELRQAADRAATRSFDTEPLVGIGSGAWRALWEAARSYSISEAYHDHEFPETGDGAVCVLCQQPLGADASDRLQRFEQYMSDTTEKDAVGAEAAFAGAVSELEQRTVIGPGTTTSIATLVAEDEKLGVATQAVLEKLEDTRVKLIEHLESDTPPPEPLPPVDVPDKIAALARGLQIRADSTDTRQFQADLASVTKTKEELQANLRVAESAAEIKAEVQRLGRLSALNQARSGTDTNAITQKASALTRQYATVLILDRFTREAERLKLERVTLQDLGGHKGQLSQKPALLGAKHKSATAMSVLSEGEQTALGLAGFFTEAVFDLSKSTIIFDDPVTSLDHVRRDRVAERLAQLAKDRQVIVFTHDVSFAADLYAAADHEGVGLTERAVERKGARPGVCLTVFPWKAKDFGARVDAMLQELSKLKADRSSLTTSEYEERASAWAGMLSETWERSVSTEIINQIFDRGKSEVRVLKLRLLAKFTEVDNTDFQEGYAHTSKWARRHDKAPVTNYVAPEPDEMQDELDRLVNWQKRMRSYLS